MPVFSEVLATSRFVALDKSPGCLSIPSRLGRADPRPCLLWEAEKAYGPLWVTHRLDFEVSGLVIFARDAEAHRLLNGWFERRELAKRYEAMTSLGPAAESFEKDQLWESRLLRGKKRTYESERGKPSQTRARCEGMWSVRPNGKRRDFFVWGLFPLSGRTHQLRFELAKRGWPIVGDSLYGSEEQFFGGDSIALRSCEIRFPDCAEREWLEAPPQIAVGGIRDWTERRDRE